MFSQKEIEYIRSPESFGMSYAYVLKHKIKNKIQTLNKELPLLINGGFLNLMDFSKNGENLTEINNVNQSLISACFEESRCGRRDLNPGRQRGRLMS